MFDILPWKRNKCPFCEWDENIDQLSYALKIENDLAYHGTDEYRPDHYEGGSERFRDIQEAYSVIGNSRRRREYEQNIRKVSPKTPLRHTYYLEPEPLIPEENPVDLCEVSPVRSFQSFTPSFYEINWIQPRKITDFVEIIL